MRSLRDCFGAIAIGYGALAVGVVYLAVRSWLQG